MNKIVQYVKKHDVALVYGIYFFVVIFPIILGLSPASWGWLADFGDAVLSSALLGFLSTIAILVGPFLFLKLYRQNKTKLHLVSTSLSFLILAFIVVSVVLLAVSVQGL